MTIGDGLLLRGGRIVVPEGLQTETLQKLHEGIVRCRLRAKVAVWWPGLSQQISTFIKKCPECSRDMSQGATHPLDISRLENCNPQRRFTHRHCRLLFPLSRNHSTAHFRV